MKLLNIFIVRGRIEDVDFTKIGDDVFELKVGKCKLAKSGIHDILKPEKAFCPYAIAVASIIQEITGKYVVLSKSEFTSDGSITKMKMYKYAII
jgi:hypothetical protein